MVGDKVKFKTIWNITKFRDDDGEIARKLQSGASIEDVIKENGDRFIGSEVVEDNVALLEGLYLLTGLISGIDTSSAKWDAANARLGVGDSSASEYASQTGLQGTNKAYKGMDGGYPQRAASESDSEQYVEWRATFGPDEANFPWQEFTVVNAADDTGVNLNRKVKDKGTKASGETWMLILKIIFS